MMHTLRNLFSALFIGAFLLGTSPALAEGPTGGDHGGDHAAEGDHGGGAHHADYGGDADGDGTANWLDSDSEDFQLLKLLLHLINLTLLLGLLTYVARRPLADALSNRAASIKKEITDAARSRDEAQQRFDELEARLSGFEADVAKMHAEAAEDAKVAAAALIERAHAEADRIKLGAERSIRDETTRARTALRDDAVRLAVQLAEDTLKAKVKAADQQNLAKEFLDSLSNGSTNG